MHLKISSAKMAAILSRSQCVNGTSTGPSLVQFRYISAGTGIAVCHGVSKYRNLTFCSAACSCKQEKEKNIKGQHWWPFVRRIHTAVMDSPHKGGQWYRKRFHVMTSTWHDLTTSLFWHVFVGIMACMYHVYSRVVITKNVSPYSPMHRCYGLYQTRLLLWFHHTVGYNIPRLVNNVIVI